MPFYRRISLGKSHTKEPVDKLLETNVKIGHLIFVKSGRHIRLQC